MFPHNLVTDKIVKKGKESKMLRPFIAVKLLLVFLNTLSNPAHRKKMIVAFSDFSLGYQAVFLGAAASDCKTS